MSEHSENSAGHHGDRTLLIRGGHLIDPAAGIDAPRDVLIRGRRVAEIAEPGSIAGADEIFKARGMIVAPGFIDLHVHLREPGQDYKETIATGTAAAAAGGFTSVCCMPNTSPVVDSPELVLWLQHPERHAVVNVFPIAAATLNSRGAVPTDIRVLQKAGAVAISDDGKPVLDDDVMHEILRIGSELSFPMIQHAEDTRETENCSMNDGPASFRLGLRGMRAAAESRVIERDVELALEFSGARLHVAHISTAGSLIPVRRAKAAGARVTCEVTPHHFTLIDSDVGEYDTNRKMNPPLRSAADRDAMIEALRDGTIDAIATDHAPHALHEKQVEFERASFGITGLESALGLAISKLHGERRIPLQRVVELFTAGPARVIDLPGRGTLAPGSHADVTIFDPRKKWTFSAAESLSRSRNTPFDGWQLTGRVVATVVSGNFVYRLG